MPADVLFYLFIHFNILIPLIIIFKFAFSYSYFLLFKVIAKLISIGVIYNW